MTSVRDTFADDRPRGTVIGSRAPGGTDRLGSDEEGVVSIDHGAIRLAPQAHPDWGRAGIAYGPFPATAGLAYAIDFLNGHNGAQDHPPRNLIRLIGRWLRASGTDGPGPRLRALFRHRDRESLAHRLHRFARLDRRPAGVPARPENLALGWFASPCPSDPIQGSGSVVVTGDAVHSGVLQVAVDGKQMTTRAEIGELPITVLGVARDEGTVLHAAIWPRDQDEVGLTFRPLGLVAKSLPDDVWVGLQQRRNSEIGFRNDTRVDSVAVVHLPEWSNWWTTAHLADRFLGDGDLVGTRPEHAPGEQPRWAGAPSGLQRSRRGLRSTDPDAAAHIDGAQPAGMVHLRVERGSSDPFLFRWRSDGRSRHWELRAEQDDWVVEIVEDGSTVHTWLDRAPAGGRVDLLLIDDGREVRLFANGNALFAGPLIDERHGDLTGLGIGGLGPHCIVGDLEAHPRTIRAPAPLSAASRSSVDSAAEQWTETFAGPLGDLDGWSGSAGRWQRRVGHDRFTAGEGRVAVDASADRHAVGRNVFTVPWIDPVGVDLSLTVTPPGSDRGQGHRGRGGIVLWEDEDNYIMINTWLDDAFDGSSVSAFFRLAGYEDVFDAVWVNVGDAIAHGRPYELGVAYRDGVLMAGVDGTPALYRRLVDIDPTARPLRITEVGLLTNWEWGTDTGTSFGPLTARRVRH